VRQGRAKNKSAGFDAQHQIDFLLQIMLRERIDQRSESQLVLQQRGDVVEQNPRLGKIRHFPDKLFQRPAIDTDFWCHYHAPSMRNAVRPGTGLASDSSTSSTRAARGPSRKRERKPASWSRLPMANTSTLPSGLLRTQPAMPSTCASCSTNQRKPTPCTRPRTTTRRASAICSPELTRT